ncbi:Putative phosphatase YitU [Durusdinium trenchii]|uniref:Phosphatase YitU n=1 Tax=Durusdinium trenchii TaxID=1381693 RepID=A0ABP0SEH1_9DINO
MSENCKMWQRRQQHSQASAGQDAAPPAAVKAPAAPSGEPDRMSCPRCGRSIRAQDDWARYQHSEQCHPEFITADFSRACILQVQSGRREKARAKEEPVSAEGKGKQTVDDEKLSVLELGAGLAVCGFVAALLGHDCISSDAEDTIAPWPKQEGDGLERRASTEAAARCNEHLLHGTQWRAEVPGLPCHDEGLSCRRGDGVVCCVSRRVIDWDSPPPWVLERSWDVVLGGDLGWSAAREFTLVRGLDQMLQNCLLRLLSQLHFTEFLLAERERDLEATEDFFEALDCSGFVAHRLPVPKGPHSKPLTEALDITLWSVRHRCLIDDCAPDPASLLAHFLAEHPWLCDAHWLGPAGLLEQLASRFPSEGRRPLHALEDLDRAGTALTSTPGLLLLNVGLVEVSFVKSLALRRKHFRTRLLMAHHDAELQTTNEFFEEVIRQGFSFHVLARHQQNLRLGIYAIDWNEPKLHVSSFQGCSSVCVDFPSTLTPAMSAAPQSAAPGDVFVSEGELRCAWDQVGWRTQLKLPQVILPDKVQAQPGRLARRLCPEATCRWRPRRRRLELLLLEASGGPGTSPAMRCQLRGPASAHAPLRPAQLRAAAQGVVTTCGTPGELRITGQIQMISLRLEAETIVFEDAQVEAWHETPDLSIETGGAFHSEGPLTLTRSNLTVKTTGAKKGGGLAAVDLILVSSSLQVLNATAFDSGGGFYGKGTLRLDYVSSPKSSLRTLSQRTASGVALLWRVTLTFRTVG